MDERLSANELSALIQRVFSPTAADQHLAILVDMPDQQIPDNPEWKIRRETAAHWASLLRDNKNELKLDNVHLVLYQNPHANNADLPAIAHYFEGTTLPTSYEQIESTAIAFDTILQTHSLLLAPTEFSATAPLKMAARRYPFRAATMPGFSQQMIPALRIDYSLVGKRVDQLKQLLDKAQGCEITFSAQGKTYDLYLDLRYRSAHASGGLFPANGVAGNLPSGESYIVPYEGEKAGEPSQTRGVLPVQFGADIVCYEIEKNSAVRVISQNETSKSEAHYLAAEPAYGNLAELGLGVLGDFGLTPIGEILLDEKLGLHIAFGRSEHFGGQVGPQSFSAPDKVVHIDRVYIPQIQPDVQIEKATLKFIGEPDLPLMKHNQYQIHFAD